MFGWYQNCFYLCTRFSEVKYSGCSAVRLAHLLWEQGVVGSNPATPTKKKGNLSSTMSCLSFYIHFSSKRVFSSDLQKRLSVCFQTQVHLK